MNCQKNSKTSSSRVPEFINDKTAEQTQTHLSRNQPEYIYLFNASWWNSHVMQQTFRILFLIGQKVKPAKRAYSHPSDWIIINVSDQVQEA